MVISKITPSLKLREKTDAELLVYTRERIVDLTVNKLKFPGLKPDAIALSDMANVYDAALSNSGKSKSATSAKNEQREVVSIALETCAQNCSEIAAGDVTLYLLSGFDVKAKAVPVTNYPAPEALSFKQGPMDGSVYANFKSVKNASGYEVMVGTSNNPATWTKITTNRSSRMLITDLTPLTLCYGRCRAIGARNIKGEWSAVVEFKVM